MKKQKIRITKNNEIYISRKAMLGSLKSLWFTADISKSQYYKLMKIYKEGNNHFLIGNHAEPYCIMSLTKYYTTNKFKVEFYKG